MNPKLIKTGAEHAAAQARIEELFAAHPGTPEGDELELLVHLVEDYESAKYPIDMPEPIDAVLFRMDQQGLKAVDLVPYIGSKSRVSEVLHRKRPLSLAMIRALHIGLGIPAHVLLQESGKVLSPVYEGVNWNDFPLAEISKRKWLLGFKGRANDLSDQAEEVLGPMLFPNGVDCRALAMAARQRVRKGSQADGYALWAWQAKVLGLATARKPGAYDPKAMTRDLMRSVIGLSCLDDGPVQACRLLEKNGIAVVVLHYLPGTHLDGAAMLRPDGKPVVALTLRHDRLDNFWFTLAHEIAHVVLHLSKGDKATFLDDLEGSASACQKEKEADDFAAGLLIPAKEWEGSTVRQSPTDLHIRDLAVRTHVHLAIIAGRIRFEQKNYKILDHLVGRRAVRKLFPAYMSGDFT